MKLKLVALDMDGTLLDSQKRLPPDFIPWVEHHPDIKTIIASGRQYHTLIKDFIPIKDKLIFVAENGGIVFEKDTIVYCNEMPKEEIFRCLERIEPIKNLTPVVCGANSAYMKASSDSAYEETKRYYSRLQSVTDMKEAVCHDTIVKIAVFAEEKKAEQATKYFADLPDSLSAVLSGVSWIDISNRTANKGSAIAAIQKKYGIDRTESMAFGDYLNDVELLQCCEESYCMENGHPDLKALAKYTTASNDNNGVMNILNQL